MAYTVSIFREDAPITADELLAVDGAEKFTFPGITNPKTGMTLSMGNMICSPITVRSSRSAKADSKQNAAMKIPPISSVPLQKHSVLSYRAKRANITDTPHIISDRQEVDK